MISEEQGKYLLQKLQTSKFRSKFQLTRKDIVYIQQKGSQTIERHTRDFIEKRLAPAMIPNDGKQTPYRGHPTFIAQHATATCCRGCLYKWHKIPMGRALTNEEQDYVVSIIMLWIQEQFNSKREDIFNH